MESKANAFFYFFFSRIALIAPPLLNLFFVRSPFTIVANCCYIAWHLLAELHKDLRVLSNGYTERERERLSLLLSASSIKQERAIDNADTGNKNQRKRQETRNVEREKQKGPGYFLFSFSERFNSISAGGSATQTGTVRESARETPHWRWPKPKSTTHSQLFFF